MTVNEMIAKIEDAEKVYLEGHDYELSQWADSVIKSTLSKAEELGLIGEVRKGLAHLGY